MSKKQTNIKKICVCAVLAALYVGLDYLAVSFSAPFGGTMKVSVSGLPVIIASVVFGPLWGAAVGFIGAFLGQLITYGIAPTTLLWVLPAVIRGISMGYLFILFKRSTKPYILCISTIISSLLVTAVNTIVLYIDSKIYHYPAALLGISLFNRILSGVLISIVFAFVLPPLVKAVKRVVR